jgi:hypothetical protein
LLRGGKIILDIIEFQFLNMENITKRLKVGFEEIYWKTKDKFVNGIVKKYISSGKIATHNVPIINNSYVDISKLDISKIDKKVARYLSAMYCEHRFDLLGTGWVKNSYDSIAYGLFDYVYNMNIPKPKSLFDDYEPIDWQKDYKSGYRWSEKTWYKDIKYGNKKGADIKIPWELSRLQHLPRLALFAILDEDLKQTHIKEFKHEILDFIVNNPLGWGVNWVCSMEVAIRVANMLLAYDMFIQLDKFGILDEQFKQIFANSIYEHGKHILNNLEYNPHVTNNHYLSNISGLIFVSAYLDINDETKKWLAFGIQELIKEMEKQFYEDGGNFESSTCYHRLSGELMVYTTALVLGLSKDKILSLQDYSCDDWKYRQKLLPLSKQPFLIDVHEAKIQFPQWFIDRLFKIGRFVLDIIKPNFEIPQFGDNDSGRFFKLTPIGSFLSREEAKETYLNLKNNDRMPEIFWDENILDQRAFLSCFAGLFNEQCFKEFDTLEKSFIEAFAKTKLSVSDKTYKAINLEIRQKNDINLIYENTIAYKVEDDAKEINFIKYPDSGVYIFKSKKFYLAICATPLGQNNRGGHTHNDKLSYELFINGKDLCKDPGSFIYTPIPEMRNLFRSTFAHNVPIIMDEEQNDFIKNRLFALKKRSKCYVCDYGNLFIELCLEYKGIFLKRRFEIDYLSAMVYNLRKAGLKLETVKS